MALKIFVGGTHRVTDPGAFVPGPPAASDDIGLVAAGHATAAYQVVGPYDIALDGTATTSTFDAVGATITGFVGTSLNPAPFDVPSPSGTVGLIGRTVNDGTIGARGNYLYGSFPSLTINLADVASPTAVIRQAVLVNNGQLLASEASPVTISGPADAVLVNDGDIFGGQFRRIEAAITGTGTIELFASLRDTPPVLTLTRAVGAGQTFSIFASTVVVEDPIDFRATIGSLGSFSFTPNAGVLFEAASTAATLIDHVLTLTNGSTLVARFRLGDDLTAQSVAIDSDGATTRLRSSFNGASPGNVTIATAGTVPTAPAIRLPAAPVLLPSSGTDRTIAAGALVASGQFLNGYAVRLEGALPGDTASLSINSVTFGQGFALKVDPAASGHAYGTLYAVGYNGNAGLIRATGAATLVAGLRDIVAPDGVTVLAATFNNTGTIDAGAGSTVRITGTDQGKLINAGTVVADGMVFIGPTVTGTGTMTVGNHAGTAGSLELGGSVATGQAITLAAGTLTIDDVRHFYATVYDFDARDTIVLKGVDVARVTYDNGKLLLDGGADGTLHVHRPDGVAYTSASFQLGHSGGDTILTTAVRTA